MTSLYDRPTWALMHEAVEHLPATFSKEDMVAWFAQHYPRTAPGTIGEHLRAMTVNLRHENSWHSRWPEERRILYKTGRNQWTRYSGEQHGPREQWQTADRADPQAVEIDEGTPSDVAELTETTAGARFALEAHLEDFMEENWQHLNFRVPISIWTDSSRKYGRQYPSGVGPIDFLCRDDQTGEFWVIELKRGLSLDRVVGQVLRYMGWVHDHLANGETVHGLIVTHEHDERLRYAVKMVPNVEAWTYRVNFEFRREAS